MGHPVVMPAAARVRLGFKMVCMRDVRRVCDVQ